MSYLGVRDGVEFTVLVWRMFYNWTTSKFINLINVKSEKTETLLMMTLLPEHEGPLDCDCADLLFLGTYSGDMSPLLSSLYIPGSLAACRSQHCKET